MQIVAIDTGNEGTVLVESFNMKEQVYQIGNANGRIYTGLYVDSEGKTSINPLAEQLSLNDISGYCNNFKALLGTGQRLFLSGNEYTPEKLFAMFNKALLDEYCASTGQNPDDIVLYMTVPTKTSAEVVQDIVTECVGLGLKTSAKNVLSEAAAAAVNASDILGEEVYGKNLVIADLGHGTLDLVKGVVSVRDGIPVFDIEQSVGEDIGGRDLDTVVLGMLEKNIKDATELDFDDMGPRDRNVIRKSVKTLKEALSFNETASRTIRVSGKDGSKVDVPLEISVGSYVDAINKSGFTDRLLSKLGEVLKGEIDFLILTGGPWKTPYLRRLAEEKVKVKVIDVDPYHAVALGCGRHAINKELLNDDIIRDKSMYAYSVTARDGDIRAYVHLPKGIYRPASFTDTYRIPENFAKVLHTDIYTSGHKEITDFNPLDGTKLGTLQIPIPPGAKAGDAVEVTVDLLIDNRIEASAVVLGSGGPSERVAIQF